MSRHKQLYDRAEDLLSKSSNHLKKISTNEIKKLVSELRIHQLELYQQNEELRLTQLELSDIKDKYLDLFEFVPVAYFVIDKSGRIDEVNLSACKLLQEKRMSIKGSFFSRFIHKQSQDIFYSSFNQLFQTTSKLTCQLKLIKRDNSLFDAHIETIQEIPSTTEKPRIRLAAVDISDRIAAEDAVKQALEEKEVLLQELNHRVKNSLQIIASFIALQSESSHDKSVKQALDTCKNRVYAMSSAYSSLVATADVQDVYMQSYLTDLSNEILTSYYSNDRKITLEIEAEDFRLDIKRATSIGIIINEMITNSLKHAFPDDRPGIIKIRLFRSSNELLTLIYQDNGIGFNENKLQDDSKGFGLQLITVLTEMQLGGTINLEKHEGVKYHLKFPRCN